MSTFKTPEQWRQLIQLRQSFAGSNVDFCKKHNISVKMFYKNRARYPGLPLSKTTSKPTLVSPNASSMGITPGPGVPRFVAVTSTSEERSTLLISPTESLSYNTRTGALTLPASFPITDMIALLKGLSQ